MWEEKAKIAEEVYGSFVDWDERFYICPECWEPVYESDWTGAEFADILCPICNFCHEE